MSGRGWVRRARQDQFASPVSTREITSASAPYPLGVATKSTTSPLLRSRDRPSPRRARRRVLWVSLTFLVLALAALVAGVPLWSGITLAGDMTALARVDVQPFGGKLESVRAFGPDGRRIPSRYGAAA